MDKILSIIIPSYNSKPFLAKCLDSLLCECTDELDIIVVNDGSTDGCEKIAEEYIEKYPDSISLINKENGGHGSGVNYVSLNGVTGIEVENRNVEKYAQAIIALAENGDLREKYGKAAKLRVKELFTNERFDENIKKLIADL